MKKFLSYVLRVLKYFYMLFFALVACFGVDWFELWEGVG
jgi:hypothetical protein